MHETINKFQWRLNREYGPGRRRLNGSFCNLAIFIHRDAFFFSSFTYVSSSLFIVGRFLSAMFRALAIPSHKRLFISLYCPFTRHCSRPLFKRRFNVLISPFVCPYSQFKRPWNLLIALFIRRRAGPYSLFKRPWNLFLIHTSTAQSVLSVQTSLKRIDCLIHTPVRTLYSNVPETYSLFIRRRLSPYSLFKRPWTRNYSNVDRSVRTLYSDVPGPWCEYRLITSSFYWNVNRDAKIDWVRHRSIETSLQTSILLLVSWQITQT